MKKIILKILIVISIPCLSGCSAISSSSSSTHNNTTSQKNGSADWQRIQPLSSSKLKQIQKTSENPDEKGWAALALISKQKNLDTQKLARELLAWREQHPAHPGNTLLGDNQHLSTLLETGTPQHIAILLPLSGRYSKAGKPIQNGFLNAYYNNTKRQTGSSKQSIKFYDTGSAPDIPALYQQAVAEGADFVVGPLLKSNVKQLKQFPTFTVPVLALNYTNDFSQTHTEQVYEFGLSPEDEARQMAVHAREAGMKQAIIIAPDTAWGKRLANALTQHWRADGGNIEEILLFKTPSASEEEVKTLLQHRADVIFLFAQPNAARRITPLIRQYDLNQTAIYASSSILSGKSQPASSLDFRNMTICNIPTNKNRLYAMGEDGYLLSQLLTQLHALPNFPVYGSTGALVLDQHQQIHRHVPCRVIES